ncbi:MAG: hypothetical protein VYA84_01855 [Planctomycetota bacterium]|nr:hypothetical protein [Planctomycetota bacterium]
MKSDHWNFLANLLGTPGPVDRSKRDEKAKKEEQPNRPASEDAAANKASPAAEQTAPQVEAAAELTPTTAAAKTEKSAPAETGKNVLEALTEAVPPKILPGFGASEEEAEEPLATSQNWDRDPEPKSFGSTHRNSEAPVADEAGETASSTDTEVSDGDAVDEFDSAWGKLAGELGIQSGDAPVSPRGASKPARSADDVKPRKPANGKKPSPKNSDLASGFGEGLGFDDDVDAGFNAADAALGTDEGRSAADADRDEPIAEGRGHRSGENRGRQERVREERGRGRRGQRRSTSETDEGADRSSRRDGRVGERSSRDQERGRVQEDDRGREDNFGKPSRGSDPGEESGDRPRGRRRQGRRGTRQRMSEEDLDRAESDRGQGDSPNKVEGESKSRGRGRSATRENSGRSSRDDSGRGRRRRERDPVDEHDEELDDTLVRETDDSEADEEAPRSRRRRGRRGRRGRRRDEETATGNDSAASEDPLARASAFDDDHEDDAEVESIRRGRGRSRSRSDDGEGRERDRDSRDSRDRDRDSRDRDPRSSRRPRGGRGRDRDQDGDGEATRQRHNVPTWVDTVDLLVNANIENHKKNKGGGRGRGGRKRS